MSGFLTVLRNQKWHKCLVPPSLNGETHTIFIFQKRMKWFVNESISFSISTQSCALMAFWMGTCLAHSMATVAGHAATPGALTSGLESKTEHFDPEHCDFWPQRIWLASPDLRDSRTCQAQFCPSLLPWLMFESNAPSEPG